MLNSLSTQSSGQGMRQACSRRGLGSKYSQIASSAGSLFAFWTQPTSRVWMPSSPRVQTAGRCTPSLRIEIGTHWFQAPSCQSYRSLCQSHTLKQLCWLSGRSVWLQFVCRVVQPSEWAHHTALLWLPPGPHSLPIQRAQGPIKSKTKERSGKAETENTMTNFTNKKKKYLRSDNLVT